MIFCMECGEITGANGPGMNDDHNEFMPMGKCTRCDSTDLRWTGDPEVDALIRTRERAIDAIWRS